MIFAAISTTISLGSIIVGILVAAGTLVAVIYGAKWKVTGEAAIALAEARGETIKDAKDREHELQAALHTSKEANAQMRQSIERLEALPNLARILEVMAASATSSDEAAEQRAAHAINDVKRFTEELISQHETKAQERHDQQLAQGKELLEALRQLNGHAPAE